MKPDIFFLVSNNGHSVYSYHQLIEDVQKTKSVPYFLKADNLQQLYTYLIAAIVNNLPVVLLDADLSIAEIDALLLQENSALNKLQIANATNILNMDDLAFAINNSTTQITLFTSGTTGQPKKVTHSISKFLSTTKKGEKYKSHVWAMAYNPTHMAGLQVLFQALANFNTIIDIFKADRLSVIQNIQQYQVTHISATPTFYRLLLPADFLLPNIQRATVGGEKSDTWLFDKLKIIFPNAKFTNIYASTEAGSLFYSNGEIFSVPQAIINDVKIEDHQLYLSNNILGNLQGIQQQWYSTGDVVEIINQQPLSFKIISRKNEMINVGGNKVNPNEIETHLLKIDGVQQAYVYGKPNSVLGNILYAEIQTYKTLEANEIRKKLLETLQDYKVPRMIKIVDKIDVTRTGKIKRTL